MLRPRWKRCSPRTPGRRASASALLCCILIGAALALLCCAVLWLAQVRITFVFFHRPVGAALYAWWPCLQVMRGSATCE